MQMYKRIFNGIAFFEKWLISLILLFDVMLTAANVLSRKLLHQNWSFTEEIVVALMVLMSLLGAALCARTRGGLINLTLFTDKMPKKVQFVLEIVMCLLVIVFAWIMIQYGVLRCMDQARMGRTTDALQIPAWIYSAFTPVGGFFLILHEIEHIIDSVYEAKENKIVKKEEGEVS